MPGIENYVEQIRRATYGRDVREAIASGIEECYSDVTQAKTIADDSIAVAYDKAHEASNFAAAAEAASQSATAAKYTAVQKAGEASQSATAAAQSVSEVSAVRDSIPADYTELSQSVVDLKSAMNNERLSSSSILGDLIINGEAILPLKKGYYYSTENGKFLPDAAEPRWMCTEKIPVIPGATYKFFYDPSGSSVSGGILLGKFLKNGTYETEDKQSGAYTFDETVAYISFTHSITDATNIRIVCTHDLQEDIGNLQEGKTLERGEAFGLTMVGGLLLRQDGSTIAYSEAVYRVSDPFSVTPGTKIIISTLGMYENACFAIYDSGSNPIFVLKNSEVPENPSGYHYLTDYIYTIPENAATMRVADFDQTHAQVNIFTGYTDPRIAPLNKDVADILSASDTRLLDVTPNIVYGKLIRAADGVIIDYSGSQWNGTELLPVTPGETYIVNSWMSYGNGMIAALDANETTVDYVLATKAEVLPDNMYHMNDYVYTIPNGAVYLFLGVFTGKGLTYSLKKVEELEFTPKIAEVKSIVEDVISHKEIGNNELISIATSDKIGFFGNSYMNGYTIRTHHVFDNLSMWSDYLFYNYGKSGDDVLETLMRINGNQTFLGTVPVQEWGITYGVLAMHANDGALFAANPETFYQNCKKVCEAIKAMGGFPILGTEHQQSQMYYGAQHLAEEEGYQFWDWGKTAAAMKWFKPFMLNGHPATRTHWSWTYGMKNYIDCLPRPMKSLKLFRKRPDTEATLEALKYNSLIERSQRFVEIYNGSACLTKATEKYFDRLNNGIAVHEAVNSEYQKLQSGTGSVSFGTHALIECVTPYTKNSISSLKMILNATGVTTAYIRRVLSLANPLPDARFVAFGVTAGASLLTPGTQFDVTGGVFNDNILGTYTVSQVVNGVVVTTTSSTNKTTSGTDNPTTNLSGVTLKGSYDYPSADYMTRYTKPLCEWDTITVNASGETDLAEYLDTHMDYDKVSILLVGSDISIRDINFNVSGSQKKRTETAKKPKTKKNGTNLLTDSLLDDGTAWNDINNVPKYTPVISAVDNETVDPLPTGITTVRELSEGDSIWQNMLTANLGTDPYHVDKIQIRVIARYFPLYVNSDNAWENSEIYEGSYDCAEMSVSIEGSVRCETVQVGASWNEFIFDVDYFNVASPKRLTIMCDKKSLQIAKVEAVVVT